MHTAEITHHAAGPVDGSGRMRAAEWRVWVPGYPTAIFPHGPGDEAKREAHGLAVDYAARAMGAA